MGSPSSLTRPLTVPSLFQKCLYRCCQWISKESPDPLGNLGLGGPLVLLASQENQALESQDCMGSLALPAPLASPGWARLVPPGSQARLDHLGNPGFVGSQGYEGIRASGGPPGPPDSLGPQALLSLGNQAPRGCQGHQDLGESQGLRGNLGPQVIEALRGIMGWASQGCLGPQGKGVPLDPLACLVQLAWANQVWMGFLGPLEIRVSLALPGCQDPGGSQGQRAQRGLLGWMVWGSQGQQECQGHRAQQGPKENQGPGALLAS